MSTNRDPMEVLVEALEARRASFDEGPSPDVVLRRLRRRRRTHARRRKAAAAAVALAVAGSGAVAWAVVHRERSSTPGVVQCFAEARLDGSSAIVGLGGVDPVERCAQAWDDRVDEWGSLPPLVACVSPGGGAVVMPGDDSTCRSLGLVDLDPTLTGEQERVVRLQHDLGEQLSAQGCVQLDEAVEIARTQLVEHQLDAWGVETLGTPDEHAPCGVAWVDFETETIYIQPAPLEMFAGVEE